MLENKRSYLTVVTNAGLEPCEVELVTPKGLVSKVLWGPDGVEEGGRKLVLGPRCTTVLLWNED